MSHSRRTNDTPPRPATVSVEHGIRTTLIGIVVNAVLACVKGVAGYLGNSYALIADAIESTTDVATSFIVWGGLRISKRPPDADHPYGHGKAEPISAVIVAVAIVAAAVTIATQSIREILTPHHAPAPFTLIVLLVVVATKETMFRTVLRVGHNLGSLAVTGDAWHHRTDAMTSAAAGVGIAVSLVGGPGYESADDWAALVAAVIILFNAVRILRPAIAEIMDAAPPANIEISVRSSARGVEGVIDLEKCFVRKMGFDYYVDLHVTVDGSLTVKRGHEIAQEVKRTIQLAHPGVAEVLVHVEPESLGKGHST